MKYISEEKERLYKTIQEEIATTNSSIRRVCMLHGMNDSKAYRRWLSKQKETEDAKVITLKPKNEVYEKKNIHTKLGEVSFDIEYSNQDELVSILRAFKNV